MGQTRAGRWDRGAAATPGSRLSAPLDHRTAITLGGGLGARRARLWLHRRHLDDQTHRGADQGIVWCVLPSCPRQPSGAGARAECAVAGDAGDPTQRSCDCDVAERTLAGTQKKAEAEGRTIIWVDEAGFYLLPARVRTYAPRGQTPVLRVPLTRDHLSAISALTTTGRVLMQVQEESFRGPRVVRFLKHLLRHIPGKLLVLWDGAPIHRSKVVQAFLAEGGAERLWLERLPSYAPELNPVEGIWRHLKRVHLRNVCCRTLRELRYELRLATANLRHKAQVLTSLPKHCGYQL